jgi:hypothetical protein
MMADPSSPAPSPEGRRGALPAVTGLVRGTGRRRLPGGGSALDGVDRFVQSGLVKSIGTNGRRIAASAATTAATLLPHIPVRDLATLRTHHHGLEGEELADALVRNAAIAVSAVGIAGSAFILAEKRVPVWLLALPVTVAAEVAAVAAIEAKLIAELHEVYGVPLRPGTRSRSTAAAAEWAVRRDIDPTDPRSLRVLAGLTVGRKGTGRIAGRMGRTARVGSAVVGGVASASAYRGSVSDLAQSLRGELRSSPRRRFSAPAWPPW